MIQFPSQPTNLDRPDDSAGGVRPESAYSAALDAGSAASFTRTSTRTESSDSPERSLSDYNGPTDFRYLGPDEFVVAPYGVSGGKQAKKDVSLADGSGADIAVGQVKSNWYTLAPVDTKGAGWLQTNKATIVVDEDGHRLAHEPVDLDDCRRIWRDR